jgi:pyruvate kinase
VLTRDQSPGRGAIIEGDGIVREPARIPVEPKEVLRDLRVGEPIWIDDGRIGGRIVSVDEEQAVIIITSASPEGARLGTGKGINLPESDLRFPSLTAQDIAILPFLVEHADLVGYSFVRTAEDIEELYRRLAEIPGPQPGVILKIETRQAFAELPSILLEALRHTPAGVMIARGDLAVECGFERLAEVQEEILWLCEAAHLPVIWATQVLEGLAKHGLASRAEITDAAVGVRAECVMLNKGPYIVETVGALDRILEHMQDHQDKKRTLLRHLRVVDRLLGTGEAVA